MLAPQTEQADAKKAELQAEIAELREGPKAGESFQESRAARKDANTPKEYTIAVYGNEKTKLTFTVDKDNKIFAADGKEITPDDDPIFYQDVEKRIREAETGEKAIAPETATAQDDNPDRIITGKKTGKRKASQLYDKNDFGAKNIRRRFIGGTFTELERQSPSKHVSILRKILKKEEGWEISPEEAQKMLEAYKQENPDWFK